MSYAAYLQRKRTHVPRRAGRSLWMVRPLRAGTSVASPQAVESPVNRCPQAVHRNALDAACKAGCKIVDMMRRLAAPRLRASVALWRRLGLFRVLLADAGVDRAVELVVGQLALDVLGVRLELAGARLSWAILRRGGRVERVEIELVLLLPPRRLPPRPAPPPPSPRAPPRAAARRPRARRACARRRSRPGRARSAPGSGRSA